ncbi:Fructokinase [Winogradskyella psychrotolerans RS-3]|uniref:Fructokinase n=1 Tax=Winogradskyella psychrotolerans RS-3 TaxID=641526 RepID=S7WU94_9FLAO|nr:carbohydrate kinase [Winogradskyella psychrotolerans]EPR70324.1 Fructokinase [Winogradskyella psychrotolerans RS-3]
MKNIVCFGEVLWDVFPTQKKIGGAPLNVALRLQSFDNNVSIITRIGEDSDGDGIFQFIKENGVAVDNIQLDSELKTGEVAVSLNEEGSASYTINYPRAWDRIQLTKSAKEVTLASDAFIYGSLSARDHNSKQTLYDLLEIAPYKVFDVNLRAPYYTKEVLNHLMESADFIKFNDDEIIEIVTHLIMKAADFKKFSNNEISEIIDKLNSDTQNLEGSIKFIAKQTNTKSICVTLGSKGAILFYNDTFYYNKGYKVSVVDTVGAGDSFLAAITDKLLKGDAPQTAIDFACAVGAVVASSEGANPKLNQNDIETLMKNSIDC